MTRNQFKKLLFIGIVWIIAINCKGGNNQNSCREFHDEVMKLYNENKIKEKITKDSLHTLTKDHPFYSVFANDDPGILCYVEIKADHIGEGFSKGDLEYNNKMEEPAIKAVNEKYGITIVPFKTILNADYYFKVYESEKFARDAFERLNNRTRREKKLPSYKVFHNKNTIFYYDDVYEELTIPQIKEVVELGKKYTGVKD